MGSIEGGFEDFDDDVITMCFSLLHISALMRASGVSKRWRKLVQNANVWTTCAAPTTLAAAPETLSAVRRVSETDTAIWCHRARARRQFWLDAEPQTYTARHRVSSVHALDLTPYRSRLDDTGLQCILRLQPAIGGLILSGTELLGELAMESIMHLKQLSHLDLGGMHCLSASSSRTVSKHSRTEGGVRARLEARACIRTSTHEHARMLRMHTTHACRAGMPRMHATYACHAVHVSHATHAAHAA